MEEMNRVEELVGTATELTSDSGVTDMTIHLTDRTDLPQVEAVANSSGKALKVAAGVGAGALIIGGITYGVYKLTKHFRNKEGKPGKSHGRYPWGRSDREYEEDDAYLAAVEAEAEVVPANDETVPDSTETKKTTRKK